MTYLNQTEDDATGKNDDTPHAHSSSSLYRQLMSLYRQLMSLYRQLMSL